MIFMGITNTAGYFSKLKNGFEELGIDSFLLDLDEDKFKFYKHKSIYIKILKYFFKKKMQSNLFLKLFFSFLYVVAIFPLFIWACIKYKVFIFGYNTSFFWFYDLIFLKFLKKKIIYVYFGSDARPPYMNGVLIKDAKWSYAKIEKETKKRKQKVIKVERYADFIINSPSCGQFHERDFINWFAIGMPTVLEKFIEVDCPSDSKKNVILHAPSRPKIKGTKIFEEYLIKISKDCDFEYKKLINVSNQEVIKKISECDFIIDEVYSDMPLAGLSSEGASQKKVSIVGGYYADYMKKDTDSKYIPPSIFVSPEDLENTIKYLLQNKLFRVQKGEEIYQFVKNNWDSKKVASKFIKIINDEIPLEWYYSNKNNNYIYGYGLEKNELKEVYTKLIKKYGLEALMLDDKPSMIKKIIHFIDLKE